MIELIFHLTQLCIGLTSVSFRDIIIFIYRDLVAVNRIEAITFAMNRHDIIDRIGRDFLTSNIEAGEYSILKAACTMEEPNRDVGQPVKHYNLDIRIKLADIVVLVGTKQNYATADEEQRKAYLDCEMALHAERKGICILSNTNIDIIKV